MPSRTAYAIEAALELTRAINDQELDVDPRTLVTELEHEAHQSRKQLLSPRGAAMRVLLAWIAREKARIA